MTSPPLPGTFPVDPRNHDLPVRRINGWATIVLTALSAVGVHVIMLLVGSPVAVVRNYFTNVMHLTDVFEQGAAGSLAAQQQSVAAVTDVAASSVALNSLSFAYQLALASAVVWFLWLWRARRNAEAIAGPGSQRLGRAWTVWGWLCPVVFFWFPYRIVVDIYRASSPRRTETVRGGIVLLWWVVPLVLGLVGAGLASIGYSTVGNVVSLVGSLVTVGTVMVIVRRISGWQMLARTALLAAAEQAQE